MSSSLVKNKTRLHYPSSFPQLMSNVSPSSRSLSHIDRASVKSRPNKEVENISRQGKRAP